jgi:hypothetical protein
MALQKVVSVEIQIRHDGTSTTGSFDLLSDVYVIVGASVQNWITENRKFALPVGVIPENTGSDSPIAASLTGSVISYTLPHVLAAGQNSGGRFRLIFD